MAVMLHLMSIYYHLLFRLLEFCGTCFSGTDHSVSQSVRSSVGPLDFSPQVYRSSLLGYAAVGGRNGNATQDGLVPFFGLERSDGECLACIIKALFLFLFDHKICNICFSTSTRAEEIKRKRILC